MTKDMKSPAKERDLGTDRSDVVAPGGAVEAAQRREQAVVPAIDVESAGEFGAAAGEPTTDAPDFEFGVAAARWRAVRRLRTTTAATKHVLAAARAGETLHHETTPLGLFRVRARESPAPVPQSRMPTFIKAIGVMATESAAASIDMTTVITPAPAATATSTTPIRRLDMHSSMSRRRATVAPADARDR